jgi:DNA polymerase alpha subunit B
LVHIVNGPIFNKNDINFDVFLQTMNTIACENPHVLVLSGPFLNIDNDAMLAGDIKLSPDSEMSLTYNEFYDYILVKLNDIFSQKRTLVILCPSLSDITNHYPLPQPPFNFKNSKTISDLDIVKKKQRLKLIGNPQIFGLNELVLGVANFDVIKDMMSNSTIVPKDKKPTDSCLEMLLAQRSFYPVLASSINAGDLDKIEKNIVVDYRKLGYLSMQEMMPDIIICPSAFQPFVKKINTTICINPGSIYKGNDLGTFAKLAIFPPNVRLFYYF